MKEKLFKKVKNGKTIIILVIIGIIISITSFVSATIMCGANEVTYTPTDTTWNVGYVDSALDELKTKVPKGTVQINEQKADVDVSGYQYADTSGMYTAEQYNAAGTTATLLWTNPSPTSSFVTQTISLNMDGYNAAKILFKAYINGDSSKIEKEFFCKGDAWGSVCLGKSYYNTYFHRNFRIVSGGIKLSNGYERIRDDR